MDPHFLCTVVFSVNLFKHAQFKEVMALTIQRNALKPLTLVTVRGNVVCTVFNFKYQYFFHSNLFVNKAHNLFQLLFLKCSPLISFACWWQNSSEFNKHYVSAKSQIFSVDLLSYCRMDYSQSFTDDRLTSDAWKIFLVKPDPFNGCKGQGHVVW